jgi:hypothetical protein
MQTMLINAGRWLPDLTDDNQCFTNGYLMVAEESSVANPQKVLKL